MLSSTQFDISYRSSLSFRKIFISKQLLSIDLCISSQKHLKPEMSFKITNVSVFYINSESQTALPNPSDRLPCSSCSKIKIA